MELQTGRLCQSCGLPLVEGRNAGTNADGSPSRDFCIYCFQDGEFTRPEMTRDEMCDIIAGYWSDAAGLPRAEAQCRAAPLVAELKRWRLDN